MQEIEDGDLISVVSAAENDACCDCDCGPLCLPDCC
jgi:hypothetical protein